MKKFIKLTFILLAAAIFSSCENNNTGKEDTKLIFGKWKMVYAAVINNAEQEFDGEAWENGGYIFEADGKLKAFDGNNVYEIGKYTLKNKTLTFIYSDGEDNFVYTATELTANDLTLEHYKNFSDMPNFKCCRMKFKKVN